MPLNVVIVTVLLGGWASSRLFNALKLPAILGMLCFGILLGTQGEAFWPTGLVEMEPFLKTFALVVILLRAGLGLKRATLNRIGGSAIALATLPCLLEGSLLTLLLHSLWDFSWPVAGLTAFMLAAVSPAVVVPSMLTLTEKGYGRKNEVPTLVMAGASADDVLAITLFSMFLGLAVDQDSSVFQGMLHLPWALFAGLLPGLALGWILAALFRKHHHQVRATEKTLILLMTALLLVEVGDVTQSAALLGVMAAGFMLLECATPVAHELAAKLNKIWVFAEIILFVLIGMQVDPVLAWRAGPAALGLLAAGLTARSLGVWIATARAGLSPKERGFCALAFLPKATVQAALGAVALSRGIEQGDTILALAVLSVLVTAPLGLFAIRWAGPRWLGKPDTP